MKQFDVFGLDTTNQCLWQNGAQIRLAPKPFAVLTYLVGHPGRLITHDELLDALWPETYVQPQVLRTYMLELRRVLGDNAVAPRFIQTLPKRGYCFLSAVVEADAATERRRAAPGVAAAAAKSGSLVGREEALASLSAQLALVLQNQRRAVFITGEAGIGKTALVEAFSETLQGSHPVTVACAQCIEGLSTKEEYYPVMEAVGHLCASPDGKRVSRILEQLAPGWMGAMRRAPSSGDQAQHPAAQRMPGDLCAALEAVAAETPLLLIFEDLHWADECTVLLISALVRRRAPARILVVATYRPRELATEHTLQRLQQDLLMRRLSTQIALEPLQKKAICALMCEQLQDSPPPGVASFVHQHSEGNPLFAIALVEHMVAQQMLVRDGPSGAAQWVQKVSFEAMEAAVPSGLAQMIELEIDRLTPREQHILQAGSLISVAFPAWAVAAALDEDVVEIEEACDGLARRVHFFERGGEDDLPDGTRSSFYVFVHSLYREVLYQSQSPRCRAKRHVRIAERLGELFSGREANVAREMALHYEAAAHWQSAIDALRVATRYAQQNGAHAEAAALLDHSLRIAQNAGEPGMIEAGMMEALGGELAAAQNALTCEGENAADMSLQKLDTF